MQCNIKIVSKSHKWANINQLVVVLQCRLSCVVTKLFVHPEESFMTFWWDCRANLQEWDVGGFTSKLFILWLSHYVWLSHLIIYLFFLSCTNIKIAASSRSVLVLKTFPEVFLFFYSVINRYTCSFLCILKYRCTDIKAVYNSVEPHRQCWP